MTNRSTPLLSWSIVAVALIVFAMASILGGPRTAFDVNLIHALAADRAAHTGLTSVAIPLTNAGGAPGMIAILAITVIVLAVKHRWRDALIFAAIVLSGRAVVELIKLAVHRPRPAFGPYPVSVSSLSFPSAHAANSMMTFLALALLVVPARPRVPAIGVALVLTGAIGATRPYLGVHWPSDVIAGWAFGIAWVVSLATASHYWRASDAARAA